MRVINRPIFSYKNSGEYDLTKESSKKSDLKYHVIIKKYNEYHYGDGENFHSFKNKWIREGLINRTGFVKGNKLAHFDCNDFKSHEKVIQAQLDALPVPLLALAKITDVNESSTEICNTVRRIVTLLSGLTFCKSADVSGKARAFLDKEINGKNVQSLGDSKMIASDELKFMQEEASTINRWIGTIKLTGLTS